MNPWIVAKFGGSSVKDANAMLRCSHIVENNPEIKVVVVSATQNTTNLLEYVAQAALRGDQTTLDHLVLEIKDKHLHIASDIFASKESIASIEVLIEELKHIGEQILKNCSYTPQMMDLLYSIGERISSILMADLLKLRMASHNIELIDARKIIKTNSNFQKAEPKIELIAKLAESELIPILKKPKTIIVTQGFIGEDLRNNTTTLGREGSDYSAALIGEAIEAKAIQIWTDVQGIASSDPRIISDIVYIPRLSYDEATALATLGAKVLFPTTLMPAQRKSIPVYVGSSINSELPMTIIENKSEGSFTLKAVTIQNQILSFVGTHLKSKENIADILLSKLTPHFAFFDLTDLSISFKVLDLDSPEALKLGHAALKSFNK